MDIDSSVVTSLTNNLMMIVRGRGVIPVTILHIFLPWTAAATFAVTTTTNHQIHHNNKVPPLPPLSLPVWSLASPSLPASATPKTTRSTLRWPSHSMNIVTFCTGLSVASPKLYAVSLYYDTLTKDSFFHYQKGVLQLLRPHHKSLVPILGKQSGYDDSNINKLLQHPLLSKKQEECAALGFAWQPWTDYQLLPNCAMYLVLELIDSIPAGDHVLAVCQVVNTLEWNGERIIISSPEITNGKTNPPLLLDPSNTLYTGQLREEGIL